MESLIRNVRDLQADKRRSLEDLLGRELHDDQQISIRVLTPGVEQDAETKRQALDRVRSLSEKGARHRESMGVSEGDADEIVDEAMAHIRQRP